MAGQHGIDGRVRQRYRLGTTRQGTDSRERAAQLGQHRRIGLDRDDLGAQRVQHGGQLAGSGAEVEHSRAGRGLQRPAHRGLRVVRAVLGVCGRRCAERRAATQPFLLFHAVILLRRECLGERMWSTRYLSPPGATELQAGVHRSALLRTISATSGHNASGR